MNNQKHFVRTPNFPAATKLKPTIYPPAPALSNFLFIPCSRLSIQTNILLENTPDLSTNSEEAKHLDIVRVHFTETTRKGVGEWEDSPFYVGRKPAVSGNVISVVGKQT